MRKTVKVLRSIIFLSHYVQESGSILVRNRNTNTGDSLQLPMKAPTANHEETLTSEPNLSNPITGSWGL